MDDKKFKKAFSPRVIYVFKIDDEKHKGLVKIGDTTINIKKSIDSLFPNCQELNQAALKRIKSYTNTAAISTKLLHTELAIKSEQTDNGILLKAFRDYEVHNVLENSNIKKVKFDESTGREWFEIDKKTAIEAIQAVKKGYFNLSNAKKEEFFPIIFRPEQKEAIDRTVRHFKKNNRMLWNAKMRFGKTLSALEVVKNVSSKRL